MIPILVAPVSASAQKRGKRDRKRQTFVTAIRSAIDKCSYYLTGDVQIDIEWLVHEKERYELARAPDVDNIIKPVLDELCGQQGILIDDNQVQSVCCSWIDWSNFGQAVSIRIRFIPDDWMRKQCLAFIHMGNNICFPVNLDLPKEFTATLVDSVDRSLRTRGQLMEMTNDYYVSKSVMPMQRVFHRSRLGQFPLIELEQFKADLV